MPEATEIKNAIEFIKGSSIYKDAPDWIAPAISSILDKTFSEEGLPKLVKSITGEESKGADGEEDFSENDPFESESEPNDIQQLTSIKNVSNIGLLDSASPISLLEGMNIFYGRNGAGKSSIYGGLCKTLGKEAKEVFPNIGNQIEGSSFCLTYKDSSGLDKEILWNSGEDCPPSECAIFDSSISTVLVDDDQDNNFTIAHLGTERFSYLHDLYDQVENHLNEKQSSAEERISELSEVIEESIPNLLEDLDGENKIKKEYIDMSPLSKTEKEKLEKNIQQIKLLGKDNQEAIIRNLENADGTVQNTMHSFVEYEDGDSYNRFQKTYFDRVNANIDSLVAAEKAYQEKGLAGLKKILPEGWTDNPFWREFINKGLDFVQSLHVVNKRHVEENCPYCRQKLSVESKNLLKEYGEVKEKHGDPQKPFMIQNQAYIAEIDRAIVAVGVLSGRAAKIKDELSVIKKDIADSDLEKVKSFLSKTVTSLRAKNKAIVTNEDLKAVSSFYKNLESIRRDFDKQTKQLGTAVSDRDKKVELLQRENDPLNLQKEIAKNNKKLVEYNSLQDILNDVETKKEEITNLRRQTSSQGSKFSEQATLKKFKDGLVEEYRLLGFTPPEYWGLGTRTEDGINKRVYNIGDKRLSDIFSDGERKIHALADFLAENAIRKSKNIYVFDDPVTSLDEDHIEYVASRLVKLVRDGNQVLIFTHNIFFLNSLLNEADIKKANKIEKNGAKVTIEQGVEIGSDSELKKYKQKIEEDARKLIEANETDPDEIGKTYCLISRYLELYVEIKFLKSIISRYRPNIRMDNLSTIKTSLDEPKMTKLSALYKKTSRRCSRHSQPVSVPLPNISEFKIDFEEMVREFPN